jgi:hypothetical protein
MMCIDTVAPPSAHTCATFTIVSTPCEHTLFHGSLVIPPTFIEIDRFCNYLRSPHCVWRRFLVALCKIWKGGRTEKLM